jgi:hypothetical protein
VTPTLHRGKLAKPPRILAVRVLTREDLGVLREKGNRATPRIKAFRDTHHRLARLVAAGYRNEEIMRQTGYSYTRLSSLRDDPAFQELVAQFREKIDAAFVDEFAETSMSNMVRAERQIEHHLDQADEAGDLLPLKLLMGLTSDRADRFGYSKKTVNTNINLDFARGLERITAQQGKATTIDAIPPQSIASIPRGPGTPLAPDAPEGPKSVAGSSAGFRRR